jgi:hypothetical protein
MASHALKHGRAGACGGVRAACDRHRRQVAVAEFDRYGAERNAQSFRCHLADDRVGAGAEFVCGHLHAHLAAGEEPNARGGCANMGGVEGGGASPPDQPVLVAGRPWARVAAAPAEGLRGLVIALHQGPAGEWFALDRFRDGVVDSTQLDRIDDELDGELVHRGFERVDVKDHWRGPHEPRRVAVRMHDVDLTVGRHRHVSGR